MLVAIIYTEHLVLQLSRP